MMDKTARIPGYVGWTAAIMMLLLILAIVLPAIQKARSEYRRVQSTVNLMQIGLAMHHYHYSHGTLPIGGTVDYGGNGHHGWYTRTLPYPSGSPTYDEIDFDHAWDDPVNRRLFLTGNGGATIPGVATTETSEGYGLIHYAANPAAFHRNSSVAIKDFTTGTSHGWLLGEAAGEYEPWGSPFNWRAWDGTLNQSPSGYGRPTGEGALFLMADGMVRRISNELSPEVRASLDGGLPVPDAADVAKPSLQGKTVAE